MAEEAVKQIKELLDAVEREYRERVGKVDKDIADAKEKGYESFSQVEANLLIKRRQHEKTYEISMERIQARLKDAEARDEIKLRAQLGNTLSQAASITASMKAKALQEWTNSGGLPGEFEATWPAIRSQILQAQAIQSITRETVSNIKL